MSIYDVPVDDTAFFPVSGDMLRQMQHEERQAEIRRRDNAIRANMPKHRAEHLIGLLNANDLGTPAKKSPEAADLNDYQEEQITMNDTASLPRHPDTNWHPVWCDPDACIPPISPDDDLTVHTLPIGSLHPRFSPHLGARISVDLVQPNDAEPRVLITNGDAELQADELDRLTSLLSQARTRLIETGED